MDEITKIKQQFALLPEDMKRLILSPELKERLKLVASNFSLTAEQEDSLKFEVLFVLVGLEFLNDFRKNIQEELDVPYITAERIYGQVKEKIFDKVQKSLEAVTDEIKDGDLSEFVGVDNGGTEATVLPMTTTQKAVLQGIENPAHVIEKTVPAVTVAPQAPKPAVPGFMDEKLSKFMKSPAAPAAPAGQGANPSMSTPDVRPRPTYNGQDPYRENA